MSIELGGSIPLSPSFYLTYNVLWPTHSEGYKIIRPILYQSLKIKVANIRFTRKEKYPFICNFVPTLFYLLDSKFLVIMYCNLFLLWSYLTQCS